ncbi:TetR/AcrR family transcriptional regulator [Streptomyces sp. NPDC058375]|uniref:TetR/AcrR family transcriptional regulator n=1 Tax=Streptomyces sp. NPDC058375 TaxID=3346467 RepID=UPI003666902F
MVLEVPHGRRSPSAGATGGRRRRHAGDRGDRALGLREIARRAGVSHGAPRRYFPTHRSLLSAVGGRGFDALKDRLDAAVDPAGDPRTQVCRLAEAYVGFAVEHRPMFELMSRHDLLESGAMQTGQTNCPDCGTRPSRCRVGRRADRPPPAGRRPGKAARARARERPGCRGSAPRGRPRRRGRRLLGERPRHRPTVELGEPLPHPRRPRTGRRARHESLAPLIARTVDAHLGPANP